MPSRWWSSSRSFCVPSSGCPDGGPLKVSVAIPPSSLTRSRLCTARSRVSGQSKSRSFWIRWSRRCAVPTAAITVRVVSTDSKRSLFFRRAWSLVLTACRRAHGLRRGDCRGRRIIAARAIHQVARWLNVVPRSVGLPTSFPNIKTLCVLPSPPGMRSVFNASRRLSAITPSSSSIASPAPRPSRK